MNEEGMFFRIGANLDGLQAAFSNIETMARQQLAGAMREVGGILTDSITRPILGVAEAALTMGSHLEQARISFTTMLGSADAANKMLADLRAFAASTPFEFPGLVDAAKRLSAMGFAGDQIIPTLNAVGNAVAALGGGAPMIDRITLALGQMQAKGKVSFQEVNQLAESGVSAWKILAEAMGKKVPEVMALAEKGMISSARAVPELLAAMNRQFGGLMEAQSKTVAGHWSNIKDQIGAVMTELGAALAPAAQAGMSALEPLIGLAKMAVDAFRSLSPEAQAVAIGIAAVAAAAGPVLVALGALGAAIAGISAGIGVLMGPAMLAGMATLLQAVAVAVATVAVAWGAWKLGEWLLTLSPVRDALDAIKRKLSEFWEWFSKLPGVSTALKAMGDAWNGVTAAVGGVVEKARAAGQAMVSASSAASTSLSKPTGALLLLGNTAEKAAKQAAAAAKSMAAATEGEWQKIALLLKNLPKSFDDFQKAVSAGFNTKGSLKALEEEIYRLEHGFRDKIPEAIRKGMLVQLNLARKELLDFAKIAEQMQLAEAFDRANKAVFAFTTDLKGGLKAAVNYLADIGLGTKYIGEQAAAASASWKSLDKDIKTLGIETTRSLGDRAKEARLAYEGMVLAAEAGMVSAVDLQKALVKSLEAQREAARGAGQPWKEIDAEVKRAQKTLEGMTGTVKTEVPAMEQAWKAFGNQVSTIFTDLGKSVASSIIHAKGFGDAFSKAAEAVKEAFLRLVVEGAINQVTKSLSKLLKDFDGFGASITSMFSSVFKGVSGFLDDIGKSISGLFGGGAPSIAVPKTGGAPGVGGGPASMIGGVTGTIGAIGSIGSMISGIIGNFQSARLETTMNAVEKEVRYSQIHLLHILEMANKWWPWLENLKWLQVIEGVEKVLYESMEYLRTMAAGGAGASLNSAFRGMAEILQSMQSELGLFRKTNNEQLRLVTEGVWATYSAVAKAGGGPGTLTPGSNGSGPTFVPNRTPGGGPSNNNVTVNLQTHSSDPYRQGQQVANSVLAVVGGRI